MEADEELQHFLQEFARWKAGEGDPVEFVTQGDGLHWLVLGGRPQPICLSFSELHHDRFDSHALVVQVRLGPLGEDVDARELLRYSRTQLVLSRLTLSPQDELQVEASVPASCLSPELLDHMLREVGSVALEFLGRPVDVPAG